MCYCCNVFLPHSFLFCLVFRILKKKNMCDAFVVYFSPVKNMNNVHFTQSIAWFPNDVQAIDKIPKVKRKKQLIIPTCLKYV